MPANPSRRRAKITLATLKHALASPREPSVTFDTELPGLALHISLKRAFWTFTYSPHGTNPVTGKRWGSTRLELGEVGVITLPEARRLALTAKAAVKAGRDPQREKTDAHASSASARGMARAYGGGDKRRARALRKRTGDSADGDGPPQVVRKNPQASGRLRPKGRPAPQRRGDGAEPY